MVALIQKLEAADAAHFAGLTRLAMTSRPFYVGVAHLGAVQGLEVLALPVVHHIAQQAIILEHDRVPDGPPLPDLGAQELGRGRLLAGDGARGDVVGGFAALEGARHEALEVWWSSNVEPYVEPSVSSYVPALRHRPTLPAILPTGSVATRPIPSRVTLYLYTTSRDHV